MDHSVQVLKFEPVLDDAGRFVHFMQFVLTDGKKEFYQAVGWLRVVLMRKFFRELRSLTELADDVVSTLYDPADGDRRIYGVYSISNIPDGPGLMQMYGVRGLGKTPQEALARARRDLEALRGVLEGKFRQIQLQPLTVEDAALFYEHLKRCRSVGTVLGHPVRRIAAGHASMDSWTRLAAQEQQEQMEVVVVACASVPFQVLCWMDPLSFEEINRMLVLTAREFSKFASERHGQKAMSVNVLVPLPVANTMQYVSDTTRSFGVTHGAQMADGRVHNDLAHFRHEDSRSTRGLDQHDDLTYASQETGHRREGIYEHQTGTRDFERTEHVDEHLDQRGTLEWQSGISRRVNYSGHEDSVFKLDDTQHGRVGEQQHIDEHEVSRTHLDRTGVLRESIDESGSRHEHLGMGYSFSERYSFGSRQTTTLSGGGASVQGSQSAYWDLQRTGGTQSRHGDETYSGDSSRHTDERGTQFALIDEAQEYTRAQGGLAGFGSEAYHGQYGSTTGRVGESRDISDVTSSESGSRSYDVSEQYSGFQSTRGAAGEVERTSQRFSQQVTQSVSGSGWRSGGGSYSADIDTSWSQHVDRTTHAHLVSDETADRTSALDRGIQREWTAQTSDVFVGQRDFRGTLASDVSEQGRTDSHLVQDSSIDRHVTGTESWQQTTRTARDTRYEQEATGASQSDLRRTATDRVSTDTMGRDVTGGAVVNQAQTAFLAAGTQQASRIIQAFGTYAVPYITAGLSRSFQTFDAEKDLAARWLEKQVERLRKGLDTGVFQASAWIAAYNDDDLARVATAMVGALREEEVVVPVHTRVPRDSAQAEDWHRHLLALYPCWEPEPVGLWNGIATAQEMTSDELAAIVHPLRVDGHGGISTSVEAIPPEIRVPPRTGGEIPLGFVVSSSDGKVLDRSYRLPAERIMHTLCIGKTGSGKSNALQHMVAAAVNFIRVDAMGRRIPVPVRANGVLDLPVTGQGYPLFGVTVFDPHGDWRRLAALVDPREVDFYSLYSRFRPLHFNPLRIPSPYIEPDAWAEVVAQRWAIAYSTGSAGFNLIRRAIMMLYREAGVYDPDTHQVNIDASRHVRMNDLAQKIQDIRSGKVQDRGAKSVSIQVMDNVLDKLWVFTSEAGGMAYEMFSAHEGATIESWMPERRVVILEGGFKDPNLGTFIMQTLASACFLHAQGRFNAHGHRAGTFPPHILVFEEAHTIMESEHQEGEVAQAVSAGGGNIWSRLAREGRKFGLYVWASAQSLVELPDGIRDSARMLVVLNIDHEKDIREAVVKMGRVPTGMTADIDWLRFFQRLPVGWGVVRLSPSATEADAMPFLVAFPNLDHVPVPDDVQLDFILRTAGLWASQPASRRTPVPPPSPPSPPSSPSVQFVYA